MESRLVWERRSNDPVGDKEWNKDLNHERNGHRSITVLNTDVLYSATYDCLLTDIEQT